MRLTLRTRSADATRTAQASATSTTTIARVQRRPRAPVAVRVPSFNASDACERDSTSAGTRPKRMAVPPTTASANASSRTSIVVCARRGTDAGSAAIASVSRPIALKPPAMVPAAASTRLSTRTWRTRRRRDAPSAARTAISRARTVARASSRLATLRHAVTSRSATAPSRTKSAGR